MKRKISQREIKEDNLKYSETKKPRVTRNSKKNETKKRRR